MRKFAKILTYSIGFIIALILICSTTIYCLPSKQINNLIKKIIEFQLSSANYKINIANAKFLKFDDEHYHLILNKIIIKKKRHKLFEPLSLAKEVQLSINLYKLYRFSYVPINITVDQLEFELAKDTEEITEVTEDVFDNLISIIKNNIFLVGSVNFINSKIGFLTENQNKTLNISKAVLLLNKAQQTIDLNLTYILNNIAKIKSYDLNINLIFLKKRYLNITANLKHLPAHLPVSQLTLDNFQNFQHADNNLAISGTIFHSYDYKKKLHHSSVNLTKITGMLHSKFDGSILNIDHSKCYMESSNNFDQVRISDCQINFTEENATSQNSVINFDLEYQKKTSVSKLLQTSGSLTNISTSLINYIVDPTNAAVIKNFIDKYLVKINIASGAWQIKLDKKFFKNHSLDDSYIDGDFSLKNTNFSYYQLHPTITNVSADIKLTKDHCNFANIKGNVLNSSINDGKINIDWQKIMQKYNTAIKINCNILGPINDYASYMDSATTNYLQERNIDIRAIQGKTITDINVHIPLDNLSDEDKNHDTVSFDINAYTNDAAIYVPKYDLTLAKANIKAFFDEKIIKLAGNGLLNGLDTQFNLTHNISTTANQAADTDFKADILISNKLTNNPYLSIIDGKTTLAIFYQDIAKHIKYGAEADLKNIKFKINKIGLSKSTGDGTFKIYGNDKQADQTTNFELFASPNIKVSGDIKYKQDITQINLAKFTYGRTKLKGQFQFSPTLNSYKIYGKSLDLSEMGFNSLTNQTDKSSMNTPAIYNLQIDNINLKNGISLKSFKAAMNYRDNHYDGYINSYLGDSRRFFDILVKERNDMEQWTITTNNIGAVLQGVNLYNNIRSGAMICRLYHKYKNTEYNNSAAIYGNINIKKFASIKTPFITKLVSFISLPGFMSTFTRRNYILFREFNSDFEINNELINIFDSSADGPFFDFSIRGQIDTKAHKYNINGEVIPSLYGISNMIKKIPLVNKIFTGNGKAGLVYAPFTLRDNY